MNNKRYLRLDVQGLRAVAVLLVLLFHFDIATKSGFVGVDAFFVISGFVIINMLWREASVNSGKINMGRFYARRAMRLLPALATMITVTILASFVFYTPLSGYAASIAKIGIAASIWLSNFALYMFTGGYFDTDASVMPLTHTWSLAVEEQFYFVIPALLVFTWWAWRKLSKSPGSEASIKKTWVTSLSLIGIISFAITMYLSFVVASEDSTSLSYYASFTRAWEFCVGALIALAPAVNWGRFNLVLQYLGLAILLASSFIIDETMVFPGYVALMPVLGTAMAIYFGSLENSARLLNNPVAVHIGNISYSLYLWHWPIVTYLKVFIHTTLVVQVLSVVLSYTIGLFSYQFIEQKFRGGQGFSKPIIIKVAVAILVPLLISGGSGYVNRLFMNSSAFASQMDDLQNGYICNGESTNLGDIDLCLENEGASGEPIYLVGDSNARMYTSAFTQVAKEKDRPYQVISMPGCSFSYVDWRKPNGQELKEQCAKNINQSLDYLLKQKPGTLVFSSSYYPLDEVAGPLDKNLDSLKQDRQPGNYSAQEAQQIYVDGYVEFFTPLKEAGFNIRWMELLPSFNSFKYVRQCGWLAIGVRLDYCNMQGTVAQAREENGYWNQIQDSVSKKMDIPIIPVSDLVCPNGVCNSIQDGHFWYLDEDHITVYAARKLTNLAERALE